MILPKAKTDIRISLIYFGLHTIFKYSRWKFDKQLDTLVCRYVTAVSLTRGMSFSTFCSLLAPVCSWITRATLSCRTTWAWFWTFFRQDVVMFIFQRCICALLICRIRKIRLNWCFLLPRGITLCYITIPNSVSADVANIWWLMAWLGAMQWLRVSFSLWTLIGLDFYQQSDTSVDANNIGSKFASGVINWQILIRLNRIIWQKGGVPWQSWSKVTDAGKSQNQQPALKGESKPEPHI